MTNPPTTYRARVATFLVLCTFVLTPAFGCSGCKGGGGGGGGNYDTPDGPFGDVVFALCDALERCPGGFGSPIAYRSNNECAAILDFVLTCRLTETEVNDVSTYGVRKIDPDVDRDRARGCIDWIESAACNQFRSSSEGGPCDGVINLDYDDDDDDWEEEPGALNEPCSYYEPCEPHLYCAGGGADEEAAVTFCEVCRTRLTQGDACMGDQCAEGLYCKGDDEMTTFTCEPIEEDGFRCHQDQQCKSGWCNQTLDEGGGWGQCDSGGNVGDACTVNGSCRPEIFCAEDQTCQNRRPNGGACSGTDSNACENYNCDPDTKICGKPEGAECGDDAACADTPCIEGICGGGQPGACTSDEHCSGGEYCAGACRPPNCDCSGSGCPVGQCTPQGQVGGAGCQDDSECPSGECDDGVCLDGTQIGDACGENYECYPYQCVNGACAEKAGPGDECGAIDSCQEPFLCIEGRCEIMNLTCAPASAGERCAWLRVCDSSSWCDLLDNVTCKPRARLGEECQTSPIRGTETCMPGSTCSYDEASGTSRCTEVGKEGEPCVSGKCTEGTFCWEGTCQSGPVGGPCDEYDGPACPERLYCNEGSCVPKGNIGANCHDQDECADGLFCEDYRSCEMVKGQNAECSDTYECRSDLYCSRDTRTCVPRLGEGLPCNDHDSLCADGFYCPLGGSTCAPIRAAGEECNDDRQCESGACYGSQFCLKTAECVMP